MHIYCVTPGHTDMASIPKREIIYNTPDNYGYIKQKKCEWKAHASIDVLNEYQVNLTISKHSHLFDITFGEYACLSKLWKQKSSPE